MLVGYDSHTIYRVYLPNEEKVICIKDLKIIEYADRKADSQLITHNMIVAVQGDITGNTPISSPYTPQYSFSSLHAQQSSLSPYAIQLYSPSYTQTKSGRISKLPKSYNVDKNNNIQILLSQLTEIFNVSN